VRPLQDAAARCRLEAERAVVEALDTSCHTPVGAHARLRGERIILNAFVGLPDGSEWITDRLEAAADDPRGAGRELAQRLNKAGAEDLLRRAESTLGA
jgi:hydroxymethylbilane synthase